MRDNLPVVLVNQRDMEYFMYGMRGFIPTTDENAEEGWIRVITNTGNRFTVNCIDVTHMTTLQGDVYLLSCTKVKEEWLT